MSTKELPASGSAGTANAAVSDMKLEVVIIPVSDVNRSKEFYARLGWRLDADFQFDNGFRVVQFTPPGSKCSIQFGAKLTAAEPGSVRDFYLIVSDISATRGEIVSRGVDISEVFHPAAPGAQFQPDGSDSRLSGTDPGHTSYRSFATFSDPDGNRWLLQEVTARLPGRVAGDTTYSSVTDLSKALQRAAAAHGWHESRTGKADPNWPDWYAEYMVREQSGEDLPR
jgi:catechol 2,3-dioxygenase-like lactoylglutathione lyase family enzyme